jgi:hypothetical protein
VRVFSFPLSLSRARSISSAPDHCLLFLFLRRAIVFRVLCGICVCLFTNFCASRSHLEPDFFGGFFSFPEIVSCLIFYFLFFWFGLCHEWKGDKEIVGEGETKRRRTTTTRSKEEEEEEGLRQGFICTFTPGG